jgi:hypothetical protein
MAVDAGLWMILTCTVALVICGCIFTAPQIKLQALRGTAPDRAPDRH